MMRDSILILFLAVSSCGPKCPNINNSSSDPVGVNLQDIDMESVDISDIAEKVSDELNSVYWASLARISHQ